MGHRGRALAAGAVIAFAAAGCSSAGQPQPSPTPTTLIPTHSTSPSLSQSTFPSPTRSTTRSATPTVRPAQRRPASRIPPVSAAARRAGLLDVRTVVPDAVIDLRYATTNNFTKVRLYPTRARCLVHRSMAAGLTRAGARARANGLVIVFWDCYRPHAVQVRMYRVVPNPNWVAKPGPYARSHEAGRSVDVTLARRALAGRCASGVRIKGHCILRMGTTFDAFTSRAQAYATAGVPAAARANRAGLRRVMGAGGLRVYSGEWWHFDGPGADVNRPHLRAPVY